MIGLVVENGRAVLDAGERAHDRAHLRAVVLDATAAREIAQLGARGGVTHPVEERTEHRVGTGPAHGARRAGVARDEKGARAAAFG